MLNEKIDAKLNLLGFKAATPVLMEQIGCYLTQHLANIYDAVAYEKKQAVAVQQHITPHRR